MIFRLTQKLAKKLKTRRDDAPLDTNPFTDWTANLFRLRRIEYVIVCNTASLYTVLFPSKGVTTPRKFVSAFIYFAGEVLIDDGMEELFRRDVEPAAAAPLFAKGLNRSVTASMNSLRYQAEYYLAWGEPLLRASARVNDTPMGAHDYETPREVMRSLTAADV